MQHKLTYLRYKLVSQTYTTQNATLWRDAHGKWLTVSASGEGSGLCTPGVIHFYDHPVLAVLFNPLHAEIDNPRLLKIRTSRPVAHDGLKGGCKSARAVAELTVPSITITQRVEFAIRVALHVYEEPTFRKWAHGWLTRRDRSSAAAASATAHTAVAAAYAAASATAHAAHASATAHAAHAAANAASAYTSAGTAATTAATAAANACAAYSAASCAANSTSIFKSVLKTMKLYKLTEDRK